MFAGTRMTLNKRAAIIYIFFAAVTRKPRVTITIKTFHQGQVFHASAVVTLLDIARPITAVLAHNVKGKLTNADVGRTLFQTLALVLARIGEAFVFRVDFAKFPRVRAITIAPKLGPVSDATSAV